MASNPLFNPEDHITPGRIITAYVDTPLSSIQQPPLWAEFSGESMAAVRSPLTNNVQYTNNAWILTTYNDYNNLSYEQGLGLTADLTEIGSILLSQLSVYNQQRWNNDIPGIPQGSQTATGSPYFLMEPAPGEDWYSPPLGAQSSYVGPSAITPAVPLVRVFVSTDDMLPSDGIRFTFWAPGKGGGDTLGTIARLYFIGMPTVLVGQNAGSGQYCLELYGDGTANLYEKDSGSLPTNPTYYERTRIQWAPTNLVMGHWHYITITSNAVQDEYTGRWGGLGQEISFTCEIGSTVPLTSQALYNPGKTINVWNQSYKAVNPIGAQPEPGPVQIDIRQDFKCKFGGNFLRYQSSGALALKPIFTNFDPDGSEPLRIEWYGAFPSGVAINPSVVATQSIESGGSGQVTLVPVGAPVQGQYSGSQSFIIPPNTFNAGQVTLNITLHYTPNGSNSSTPRVQIARAILYATFKAGTLTPTELPSVDHFSATGQTWDPSLENCGLTFDDALNQVPQLAYRGGMGMQVQTTCGECDPTLGADGTYSILFGGIIDAPEGSRRGPGPMVNFGHDSSPAAFPAADWNSYAIRAFGMWQFLMYRKMPLTYNFANDPNLASESGGDGVNPYYVSDAINLLFQFAGFPQSQIIVDSIPIQLFASQPEDLNIETFSDIGPIIAKWANLYAGAYVFYDWNATNSGDPTDTLGAWRVKLPPRPDPTTGTYNYLGHFVSTPPWSGSEIMSPVSQSSYYTFGNGGITFVPILAENEDARDQFRPSPPEFNDLVVTGVGLGYDIQAGSALANEAPHQLTYHVYNPKSFQISSTQSPLPDPGNPDYLGYRKQAYFGDAGLNTDEGVAFATRRIYDMGAHTRKHYGPIIAPLVLIVDPTDEYQIRPRPYRFGDPVTFDGVPYFVETCNPHVDFEMNGGGSQLATYTFFSIPELNGYMGSVGPNELLGGF